MEFAKQVSRIVGKSGAEAKAGRESMAKYDTIDEVMEALYDCISAGRTGLGA